MNAVFEETNDHQAIIVPVDAKKSPPLDELFISVDRGPRWEPGGDPAPL